MPRHFGKWAVVTVVVLTAGISLRGQEPAAKKYALLAGVNRYQHEQLPDLRFAENDVEDLAAFLVKQGYEVAVLTGSAAAEGRQATRANIEKQMRAVLQKCKRGDTVVLGFAGHGLQFEGEKDCYFCPLDARPLKTHLTSLLSLSKVYEELDGSFAGMKVLLVDACRNDPDLGRGARNGITADQAPRPPQGVAALFSCSAGERAFEHPELKHGVFFHYVLEGLKGAAKDGDGEVTFAGLASYVSRRVSRDVPKRIGEGAKQSPNLKADYRTEPVLAYLLRPEPERPAAREPKAGEVITNSVGMKLVWVPAGKFMMGSTKAEQDAAIAAGLKEEWVRGESPRHEVELTRGFYLGMQEVTIGQFKRFVSEEGYVTEAEQDGKGGWGYDASASENQFGQATKYSWRFTGWDVTDAHPVVNVSWNDAKAYCRWLSRKEGKEVRLPTEAEWEYACRGGTTTAYQGGDDPETLAEYGNVADGTAKAKVPFLNGIVARDGYVFTAPVGQYRKNGFGLQDMHGNVWEWCEDCYSAETYNSGKNVDPTGPSEGSYRVFRGGGWDARPARCRSAVRAGPSPSFRNRYLGFRVLQVHR